MRETRRVFATGPGRERVDWWQVVTDLERRGISHERVAAECLRSKSWVDCVKNGQSEPRFHDGLIVLSLWAHAIGRPLEERPRQEQ